MERGCVRDQPQHPRKRRWAGDALRLVLATQPRSQYLGDRF